MYSLRRVATRRKVHLKFTIYKPKLRYLQVYFFFLVWGILLVLFTKKHFTLCTRAEVRKEDKE